MQQQIRSIDQSFSLTLVLHDIMRRLGYQYDLVDLHAIMGLPMLVCAPVDKRCETPWPLLSRDIVLLEATRALGLTIRDLHPPEASRDLCTTEEFAQHFEASYLPLVERVLENNQSVIAWQGWADTSLGQWGLVTSASSKGIGLLGLPYPTTQINSTADKTSCQEIPLTRSPVQLYVIETANLTPLSSDVFLSTALDNTLLAHSPERANRFDVITGAVAYDHWIDAIMATKSDVLDSRWIDFASSIVVGHDAGLRFFERHQHSIIAPDLQKAVVSICDACNNVMRSLESITLNTTPNTAIDQLRSAQRHTDSIIDTLHI